MSISALSTNLITDLSQQQRQNPFQQIKQDFQQLASALQSGDLQGAQSAYSNIQQVLGSGANSSGSGGSNALQNDFATLGQALQSGDLTQAQSAFSQLQSDVQTGRQYGSAGAGAAAQAQDQYVSSAYAQRNAERTAEQDYTQIGKDLQAGDLTNAQSAYSNLEQLVQAYPGPSGPSSNTPTAIQSDFATLGQDLQAGNLTQSQGAFTQLQNDIQAATQNPVQQVQQDYTQLASALQSGNLTGAQSAFAALEQALQKQSGTNTPATAASTNSNDPIANDLNALGQALSSGNLNQAQSAFTQLNTDIQSAQQSGTSQAQNATQPPKSQVEGHHHHHHGGGDRSSTSSSQSSSSTTSAANSYTSSTTGSSVSVYA